MNKRYKVLLLGDSIRMGYQEYVKNELKDIADVYAPNDNGRFIQFSLALFHVWSMILSNKGEFDFDVIHFNSGLWDVLRLSNEEECFNSPEQYRYLLIRLVNRVKFFYPKAKIVFALTTKVQEPGYIYGSEIGVRKNSDIERYNKIAVQLFEKMEGIEVNDLWKVSVELENDAMSDEVHYSTKKGEIALGGAVAKIVRELCEK